MNLKIEEKLETLPALSGVYLMYSKDDVIIYVGKAKSLKSRVLQYFKSGLKPVKVSKMVENIEYFDYIITPTETDALALENNLIKKYQPFYNILLKDGKTFPFIKIDMSRDFPKLEVVRRVKNDGAKYFGPYIVGISANALAKTISDAFKIRSCSFSFSETKSLKRECLNFFIGICDAPCTKRITKLEYLKNVDKAISFLKGNDKTLEIALRAQMAKESERENFENAIKIRERLNMIQKLKDRSIANQPKNISKDAISLFSNGSKYSFSVVMLRGGKILGVFNEIFEDSLSSEEDALSSFVTQYYVEKIIPKEIILSHKIEDDDSIQNYFDKKINFITNPKGSNLKLLNMATQNAEENFTKTTSRDGQKYNQTFGAMKNLKEKLSLTNLPRRIECFDISNISGTDKVASMIVFINGEKNVKLYRKFKIKEVEGQNDYASLQEAMTRRLQRLIDKNRESFSDKPDLIVIDGGKGQLSSVMEIIAKFKITGVDVISLAERIEEVFLPYQKEAVYLHPNSEELKLLQRVRDEAHRFAITFHRSLRNKRMVKSELDNIKGIGSIKKNELLKAYKTSENISSASASELASVAGINPSLAQKIYEHFHKGD